MTKPVSKPTNATNPTQLDGVADKISKKSKSAKRVNQPQPDNTANSSGSCKSDESIKAVKSRNVVINPNLFADELVPSATPEGASEQSGVSSTDSKNESVELSPANSSDEKKSSDGDVALDLAPPKQPNESDSTPDVSSSSESSSLEETASQPEMKPLKESDSTKEMDSATEMTSAEESTESDELKELAKSEESNSKEQTTPSNELTPPNESKPTRVSAKMRRQELDDYVEQFLQPGQIAKRHTVVIEEDTWKRISYNVRKIGLEDSTGSAYVEAIIRDHLDRYEDKVEEWRKL
ncbi:MAG: DUF3408 domain-containing protein [Candidatus Amulumruptor caecigallinarius]|nr:DUF3408 domain-containing protein [Candidatus Amulumruptor caecigallinarius]